MKGAELSQARNAKEIFHLLKKAGITKGFCEKNKVSPLEGFPYGRNVILSTEDCEIMLASWAPNIPCSPHNHGHSKGWVFYLKGEFRETIYDWVSGELSAVAEEIHMENTHTSVAGNITHSCMAIKDGLSLHVYFPRIESMKVHDLPKRRTLVVSDDCGAWIPGCTSSIKEEFCW